MKSTKQLKEDINAPITLHLVTTIKSSFVSVSIILFLCFMMRYIYLSLAVPGVTLTDEQPVKWGDKLNLNSNYIIGSYPDEYRSRWFISTLVYDTAFDNPHLDWVNVDNTSFGLSIDSFNPLLAGPYHFNVRIDSLQQSFFLINYTVSLQLNESKSLSIYTLSLISC